MASPFNPEYVNVLNMPVSLSDGPRKDAIDALQNQIEFYTREILRLRSSQNSHVPIAGMPAELLSEVFCHIVESGVEIKNLSFGIQATPQDCDARFGIGTFGFRQVCKHWNKVAIGSPQLWVWWVAGATKAWPLFYERSKGSPISLIWRYPRSSTVRSGVLKDAALLGRIHRLDFGGEYTHFKRLFSALDSTSLFNASSVRLEIAPYNRENSEERLVRFFSLSFPKLSKLDVKGFLPDPLSPAFASSILTSLKLSSSARDKPRYTLAQFSRILHNLPNLQKLDLEDNAIPRIVASEVPVPYALSRLADLTLRGMMGCISGFMNLVDMSSPPHNIILGFRNHYDTAVPALVDTVKGILAAYYQRTGLTYPRNAANFMVKYKHWKESGVPLIFDIKSAKSRSAPPSTPQFTLRLEFLDLYEFHQLLPLFPLKTVQSFTADGLFFSRREYRSILWKMNHLLHLHLAALDIKPVLEAMNYNSPDEPAQVMVPKLVSLTLSRLKLLDGACDDLRFSLQGRHDKKAGLGRLIVCACRVHSEGDLSGLKGVVKEMELSDLEEVGSEYEESEKDPELDSDNFMCHCRDCPEA